MPAISSAASKDWNLKGNQQMFAELQDMGVPSMLEVLPGEHAPGPNEELFAGHELASCTLARIHDCFPSPTIL